jgi:hypothetical protein
VSPYLTRDAEPTSVVSGVGTGFLDGEPTLVIFTAAEPIETAPIATELHASFRVKNWVTGRAIPAARPAQGADSVSGTCTNSATGTLACRVHDGAGSYFLLGCNHTLAGVNQAQAQRDTVWQPGSADGGTAADTLGTIADYEDLHLGGITANTMDAAIAAADPTDLDAGVRSLPALKGFRTLQLNERVTKIGRTTQQTRGTNVLTSSYLTEFPSPIAGTPPDKALFVDQHTIQADPGTTFADVGDSGAAVLTDPGNELIGIVVGVLDGSNLAFVSPITPVLRRFGVVPG